MIWERDKSSIIVPEVPYPTFRLGTRSTAWNLRDVFSLLCFLVFVSRLEDADRMAWAHRVGGRVSRVDGYLKTQ